jgi:DNA polymerase alpha-associated DNA helicase A
MQLPPTIISIDKEKKVKAKKAGKQSSEPVNPSKTPKLQKLGSDSPPASGSDSDSEVSGDKMLKTSSAPQKSPILRPPRTLETTLFDRLEQMYGSRIKRMLEIQYRSVCYNQSLDRLA